MLVYTHLTAVASLLRLELAGVSPWYSSGTAYFFNARHKVSWVDCARKSWCVFLCDNFRQSLKFMMVLVDQQYFVSNERRFLEESV